MPSRARFRRTQVVLETSAGSPGPTPDNPNDWGRVNVTATKFEDFGLITDPVTESEDWGELP